MGSMSDEISLAGPLVKGAESLPEVATPPGQSLNLKGSPP